MAPKVTSSGNRSGRKPSKPPVVTSSKGRGNRSNVSTARVSTGSNGKPKAGGARVTNSSQRTNTGSTRVTGGGSRPALPPGQRGGALATTTRSGSSRNTNTSSRTSNASQGPVRPPAGNSRANAPAANTRPGGGPGIMPNSIQEGRNLPRQGAAILRQQVQGPRASAKPSVTPAVKPRLTLGRGGAATLALSAISGIQDKFLTQAQLDKKYENEKGKVYRELMDKMSGKQPVSKDANGRSSQGIRVSDKGNKRDYVSAPTGSQEYNDFRSKQIEAEKQRLKNVGNAPARSTSSSTSSRSSGTPARMPSAVTRSSTPKAPAAPAKAGQKFEDFNPNRGTSKTNNPLMKDFVGRMKDREDKAQASAASKVTSKFNTESNFSAEKVDGSKVDTKAKMKSTTSEYDKKKRRYGG